MSASSVVDLTTLSSDDDDADVVFQPSTAASASTGKRRKRAASAPKEKRLKRYRGSATASIEQRIARAISQRLHLVHQEEADDEDAASSSSSSAASAAASSSSSSASASSSTAAFSRKRTYHVLGSTGNVYHVQVGRRLGCTCPDADRGNLCKHQLFVMLKVLKVHVSTLLIP